MSVDWYVPTMVQTGDGEDMLLRPQINWNAYSTMMMITLPLVW